MTASRLHIGSLGLVIAVVGTLFSTPTARAQASHASPDRPDLTRPLVLEQLLESGRVAYGEGHFEEAERAWTQALTLDPLRESTLLAIGLARLKLRHYDLAAETYQEANKLAPKDLEAIYHLGLAYSLGGRDVLALAAYQRAAALSKSDPRVLNNLGQAYLRLNRAIEARDCFEGALAKMPEKAELWYNLGLAHRHLGDELNAVVEFERALALAPHWPAARTALAPPKSNPAAIVSVVPVHPDTTTFAEVMGRARSERAAGRWREAIELLRSAANTQPLSADAFVWIGEIYALNAAPLTAETLMRKAIALAPKSANARAGLGLALGLAERDGEALAAYQEALRINPHCFQALRGVAMMSTILGDRPAAIEARKRLERLSPDAPFGEALQGIWDLEDRHPIRATRALHHFAARAPLHPASLKINELPSPLQAKHLDRVRRLLLSQFGLEAWDSSASGDLAD
jgi:tetratricopeptide (TPR) repeat protein